MHFTLAAKRRRPSVSVEGAPLMQKFKKIKKKACKKKKYHI